MPVSKSQVQLVAKEARESCNVKFEFHFFVCLNFVFTFRIFVQHQCYTIALL